MSCEPDKLQQRDCSFMLFPYEVNTEVFSALTRTSSLDRPIPRTAALRSVDFPSSNQCNERKQKRAKYGKEHPEDCRALIFHCVMKAPPEQPQKCVEASQSKENLS